MSDPRLDVCQVLARFTLALDGRDWPAYRAVFTDEVDVDYSSYRPGSVGRMPAGDWVARAERLFPGLDATQHALFLPEVVVDGDHGSTRTPMRADHFLAGERYSLGGVYLHRLVRTEGVWRISAVTLQVRWTEGDRDLLVRAARHGDPGR